jgi:hypothetical protein
LKEESDETFAASSQGAWNVLHLGAGDTSTSLLDDPAQLPLVGHFVSVLFPMVRRIEESLHKSPYV